MPIPQLNPEKKHKLFYCGAPAARSAAKRSPISIPYMEIKGSLSSSWMNSQILSLLSPLWQNESLCETIGTKIYFICSVIRMKINILLKHSFCKRQLRRWKLTLHMCQAVHQASTHSSFCRMKRLGLFLLPPWMGCISIAGLPPSIKFASTYLYT